MLSLADYWIWDSWIADDGETYHLYFLQAPRSLVDAGRRHTAAQSGTRPHGPDNWTYQGVALAPGPRGVPGTIWRCGPARPCGATTACGGCTTRRSPAPAAASRPAHRAGRVRRPAHLAPGRDRPLLEADPRWYMTLGLAEDPVASETWRDPFVFRDPDGDGWHMSDHRAREGGAAADDGVIAHAPQRRHGALGTRAAAVGSRPGSGRSRCRRHELVRRPADTGVHLSPDEQTDWRKERSGLYCTWSVPGESLSARGTS